LKPTRLFLDTTATPFVPSISSKNLPKPQSAPVTNINWSEVACQSSKIFLFLHKNVTSPPPLPFTTKIEIINGIFTISHYLQPSQPSTNPFQTTAMNKTPPKISTTLDCPNNICTFSLTDNASPSPVKTYQSETTSNEDTTPLHHEKASAMMNTLLHCQKQLIRTLQSKIDTLNAELETLNAQLETSTSECKNFISSFQSTFFKSLTMKLHEKSKVTSSTIFHLHDLLPILDSINIQPPSRT